MNYNPITDKTLLSKIASNAQAEQLKNIINSATLNNNLYFADVSIGNSSRSYTLRLVTNYKHLEQFWKLNFREPKFQTDENPDGHIYALNTDRANKLFNYDSQRYFFPTENTVVSFNNDFYGNLKISYRGLVAHIASKDNLVSMHSSAVNVKERTVLVTGISGAGKTTIVKYLLHHLNGKFIWDDWGFVDSNNLEVLTPNEIHNHLKISSLIGLLPLFDGISNRPTEFHEIDNPFFDNSRVMIDLRDHLPFLSTEGKELKVDTLIIITNDRKKKHTVEKINQNIAKQLFFTPVYSTAYQSKIHYFDGSLFLDESLKERYDNLFGTMLSKLTNIIHINNNYTGMAYRKLEELL